MGRTNDAIQAVADAYAGLRVVNGYKLDVRHVTRVVDDLAGLPSTKTPAIAVARVPGQSGQLRPIDGAAYRNDLDLAVTGWIPSGARNPHDSRFVERAEEFLSEMKRLQMADPSFGERLLIKDSTLMSEMNDAAWDEDGAVVSLVVRLLVEFDVNDP